MSHRLARPSIIVVAAAAGGAAFLWNGRVTRNVDKRRSSPPRRPGSETLPRGVLRRRRSADTPRTAAATQAYGYPPGYPPLAPYPYR